MNTLYYGDNRDVLRRYVADESVDLVYLDPPFKSNQDYNVLFAEQDGSRSASQIKAFEDTWRWDQAAAAAYEEVVEGAGRVSQAMQAFRTFLGESDMLAYLAMMAPRLIELRRVLKPTGSIYLHCDPTASHYLKMLMDAIFGPQNFVNEIVWKRSSAHSDTKQGMSRLGRVHDVLLFYSRGERWTWNTHFVPYSDDYLEERFKNVDARGQYKDADLTAARPGGDTSYEWPIKRQGNAAWQNDLEDERKHPKRGWEYKSVRPPSGRYWAYSKQNMRAFAEEDRLHYFSSGMPRLKQYADDMAGVPLQDIWADIPPINSQAQERLGYPTQKPEALLERIIRASSQEGETVLDPFCGCGTAVAVSQRLNRRWIGIDITHLAITLIRHRLFTAYGGKAEYEVIGEPVTLPDAEALASEDKYQFQWWTLGLVGARPTEQKKGADKGIDGRLYFHDEGPGGKTKQIILSVKGGDLKAQDVRDLRGVIERERAEIGVLLTLEEPTKPMRTEAAAAGFYKQPVVAGGGQQYPRLQILTVGELLAGQRIKYPSVGYLNVTYKQAPKARTGEAPIQGQLPMVAEPPAPRVPRRPKSN